MMLIENKFNIGDIVYLKTDQEQKERQLIGIWVMKNDIQYQLASGTEQTWHFDIEIEMAKDMTKV